MYFYEKKYYWILNKFDETIRIKQHMPKWILDFNINDYKIEDLERMDNDSFKVSISIERWKSSYYDKSILNNFNLIHFVIDSYDEVDSINISRIYAVIWWLKL